MCSPIPAAGSSPIRFRSCATGEPFLFFEDLDHHVGKGIISAVEFGAEGPIGAVFPVIEEPWHMSYPFMIEAEGQLWMVPESSKSGQVTLYRCVEFPGKWERSGALARRDRGGGRDDLPA